MKVAVAAIVVVAVLLSTGIVLFFNGYGPMALRDKRVVKLKSPAAAKERIDEFLRATMDGISPPVTYLGGDYQVTREHDHWDGEPNLKSQLFGWVTLRTRISSVKLPVLLDQISRIWEHSGCSPVSRSVPEKYNPGLASLRCEAGDYLFVDLIASSNGAYDTVSFGANLDFVRYRPAGEYGPVPPLAKRPKGDHDADTDDPYWSH
ncbi:hypothetical protein ACFVHB_21850 [Kitasatospora sp. NPDC127111]|uniref:hypothetical protein n=1 Tax=Kitasatospora sp. NPDC127111 TaxID=3345363 RepID=UPI00362E3960